MVLPLEQMSKLTLVLATMLRGSCDKIVNLMDFVRFSKVTHLANVQNAFDLYLFALKLVVLLFQPKSKLLNVFQLPVTVRQSLYFCVMELLVVPWASRPL